MASGHYGRSRTDYQHFGTIVNLVEPSRVVMAADNPPVEFQFLTFPFDPDITRIRSVAQRLDFSVSNCVLGLISQV